jgi:hypothetical protein
LIVSSLGYVLVHQDPSRVDCLPDAVSVGSALDLLNQHWPETLASQLLFHAQEVNLDHADLLALGLGCDGDGTDEAVERALFAVPHSYEPLWLLAWDEKGPLEEVYLVIEAEGVVTVLHVVVSQELI